jgi:hypothetical protein
MHRLPLGERREPATLVKVTAVRSLRPRPGGTRSYRAAGMDVPNKMLAVVVSDVEIESEYQFERRMFGSNPERDEWCGFGSQSYFFPYSMCSRSDIAHTGPRSRL